MEALESSGRFWALLPRRVLLALGVLSACGASWPARAIPPPLTDEQLVRVADLIATGTIQTIRERDQVTRPYDGRGFIVTAHLTVTMRVRDVEKGSLPSAGRTIRFTVDQTKRKSANVVGGPINPPDMQPGDRLKVFLVQEKANWAPVNGQGVQVLP